MKRKVGKIAVHLRLTRHATVHILLTNWHWFALNLHQHMTDVRLQYANTFISHRFLTSVL